MTPASPQNASKKSTKYKQNRPKTNKHVFATAPLPLRASCNAFMDLQAAGKVELLALLGHVRATGDAENAHARVVPQTSEQLGCNEEVLRRVLTARDLDHALVHHALVARVHTLVDLVNHAERRLRHGLESHQVEDGGNSALATRLAVLVKLLEGLVFSARLSVTATRARRWQGALEGEDVRT